MRGGLMTAPKPLSCPYQDGECPHIQEVKDELRDESRRMEMKIDRIQQLLYVIAGIVSITCGVSIW